MYFRHLDTQVYVNTSAREKNNVFSFTMHRILMKSKKKKHGITSSAESEHCGLVQISSTRLNSIPKSLLVDEDDLCNVVREELSIG